MSPRELALLLLDATSSTVDACFDCASGGVPEDDGGDVSEEDDAVGPEESVVEGVLKPEEEREEGEEFRLSLVGVG